MASEMMTDFDKLKGYAVEALTNQIGVFKSDISGTVINSSFVCNQLNHILDEIKNFPTTMDDMPCMGNLEASKPSLTPWDIPKVLQRIWSNSSNSDLLNFRCLNRRWNRLISMALLKRNAFHVRLYYSDASQSYMVHSPDLELHLGMLNECLELSKKFPVAEVRICGGNLNEPDLLRFLTLHGSRINTLVLQEAQTAIHFPQLFSMVPNIETLKLIYFGPSNQLSTNDQNSDSFNFFPSDLSSLKLPCLENLELEHLDRVPGNFDMLVALRKSTARLRNISLKQMKFVDCFSDCSRLIRRITFDSHHDIQFCSSFACLEPELRGFSVDLSEFRHKLKSISQVASPVESILVSSKDSLEELTLTRTGLMPVNLPVFSKLKRLNLLESEHGDDVVERILPNVASYWPLFPCLETVVISVELCQNKLFMLFPEDDFKNNSVESFPTVRNLTFINQSEGECISEILFLKFPNVSLVQFGAGKLSKTDYMLWCMPHSVKTIVLSDESFETGISGPFVSLDSLMTGISVEKCDILDHSSGVATVKPDSLRSEPWIGALKNLQHLKIIFTSNDLTSRLLTLVSFLYGFDLLPALKITLAYDFSSKRNANFRKLYGPVLPYVTVRHERSEQGLLY